MNKSAKVVVFQPSTGQYELWLCGTDHDGVLYPLPGTGGVSMPAGWTEALQDYNEKVKNDQVS